MAAYSNDLRSKLILAWRRGENTEQELADNFSVSRGWVQKVIRHWRRTKQTAAPLYRHGPLPKIDPARLIAQVEADPDATLKELAKRLPCPATTWLTTQKKRCTPANGIPLGWKSCARVGKEGFVIKIRDSSCFWMRPALI